MKIKYWVLSAALTFGASGSAFAYTIPGGTDVGGLDTWVATTTGLNSGEASETTWASGQAGTTLTFAGKSDPAAFQVTLEDAAVIAFQLFTAPSYFLVKDAQTHVLFKNEQSMDWGVFNLLDYFGSNKLEELELSHLTEFSGSPATVPEPGTLGLLGLGILSLLTIRRKRQRNA